jgi:hypothetical protein
MPIPKPSGDETQDQYVGRCMHSIASEYDTNEQAVAICISTYEKGTMSMSRTPQERVQLRIKGVNLIFAARLADDKLAELAEEGGGSYPWEDCIADQIKEYGDEETAKKVCGYIKSKYGS